MNRPLAEMFEIEQKLGVANKNWLMSTREKLGLIGLLHCMNPCTVLELGYHRGGTTQWITRFAKKVITVDVNEFVSLAPGQYSNLEAWNCSTLDAINRIKKEKLYFDLAIIDADHSKNAVFNDVTGILPHSEVILMHDSFNPECRKGMLEALKTQKTHAYFLDFIPSSLKHDGLWGGIGIAWKSNNPGLSEEFPGEISPYNAISRQNLWHFKSKISGIKNLLCAKKQSIIKNSRILGGKLLGR